MLNSDLAFKKFANLTERKKMIKSYFRSIRDTKNLTEIFTQIIEKLLKNKSKQLELNTLKVKYEFRCFHCFS